MSCDSSLLRNLLVSCAVLLLVTQFVWMLWHSTSSSSSWMDLCQFELLQPQQQAISWQQTPIKRSESSRLIAPPVVSKKTPLTPFYTDPKYAPPEPLGERAFPVVPWGVPCETLEEGYHRGPTQEGFLYLKEFKTGSSTLAGVTLRIARNVAKRRHGVNATRQDANGTTTLIPCKSRFVHTRVRKFRDRIPQQSFLWTVLREPTDRLVSKFFHFSISRNKTLRPTLDSLQDYFRDDSNSIYDRQYYIKTLIDYDMNPRTVRRFPEYVQSILKNFDFMGITERMDESLVVLQLLLNLETGDLLYLSSKASGTFEWFARVRKCIYILKSTVTPDMKEWFQSEEWWEYVRADVYLYQAANKSLDLTIEQLGRDRVDRALRRFHYAQELAYEACANRTVFPCTLGGTVNFENDCLWVDNACGYQCLDQVAESLATHAGFQALPEP